MKFSQPFYIALAAALSLTISVGCYDQSEQSAQTSPSDLVEAPAAAPSESVAPSSLQTTPDQNTAAPLAAQNQPVPLAQETSDIATDPAVTWGLLENGMRYAILPNSEPPGRISLRLHVDAGSLMENDNQQGLAHFLEHMAFNGTTNFEPGTMVKYFQRLGMGFGNHTNAHTSFNETVYKLELPNTETNTLDESFKLLRDFADGMKLSIEEIDQERGIIMSEKRDRDSVEYRTFVDQLKFALPDSLLSSRWPIGIEEVIQNAPRERFVEFYRDWYTPNRMVLIAVGDTTVETIQQQINKYFGDAPAREKTPDLDLGKITNRGLVAHYHPEKEAGETTVSIDFVMPPSPLPYNKERAAQDLRLNLAKEMLSRRLDRLAKKEDSPINEASVYAGDLFDLNVAATGSVSADCQSENWLPAFHLIEQELRRVIEHGFTDSELAEAKANQLNHFQIASDRAATRLSRALADRISQDIGNRRVFVHPTTALEWAKGEIPKASAAECLAVFKNLFGGDHETQLSITGNIELDDAKTKLIAAYNESRTMPVDAPLEKAAAAFAYAELPEAGKIAELKEVEDLGITQLKFENEVRVNLKQTDFEQKTIHLRVRLGSGKITEPKDKPGLATFLSSTFISGGLEAHSYDDLQRLFAGKTVSTGMNVDDDAFTINGRTNQVDLLDQLLMIRAYLTNPGFRPDSVTQFRGRLGTLYQQLEGDANGVAEAKGSPFLHGGDTRFGFPERAVLESRTIDEAKSWILPALQKEYLEFSIVGDFDRDLVIDLVAKTFGNLPPRQADKPRHEDLRAVSFPAGGTVEFTFKSKIPKGLTNVYWPSADMFDIRKSRRLGMLGAVMDDRLREKVREELGDSYSPFAHNIPSDTWQNYGYLFASVTVDPTKSDAVAEAVTEIAKELSSGDRITQDELERAKKPNIVSIEEMRRTNRYWLGSVMASSQEYPERLEWARHFIDDYTSISVDDVNQLAKEYLKEEKMVIMKVTPLAE